MPSKNIVKEFDAEAYYHAYNRGVEKRKVFLDDEDYAVFLNLIKRYVDLEPAKDSKGREYEWLGDDLAVVAFCLMPNHFHLFLYQSDSAAMTYLMRAVTGAYTVYFNKKYDRVGSLFQATYKAVRVNDEAYFDYITRYIHRNPRHYQSWEWSSYRVFIGTKNMPWVHPEKVIELSARARRAYERFVSDQDDYDQTADIVEEQLAS